MFLWQDLPLSVLGSKGVSIRENPVSIRVKCHFFEKKLQKFEILRYSKSAFIDSKPLNFSPRNPNFLRTGQKIRIFTAVQRRNLPKGVSIRQVYPTGCPKSHAPMEAKNFYVRESDNVV